MDGTPSRLAAWRSSAEVQWYVSAMVEVCFMSRRQRQFSELQDLCSAGGVVHAIDLAFEHFAQFGRDEELIDLLARALRDAGVGGRVWQRFAELCTSLE